MFYSLLKVIFKVALRIFFRQIEVQNKHLIPKEGPLLLVANHPNTFMDPVAIGAVTKQEVFFIAKSTLFNSAFNKWLLNKMNLVPVYRREDGNTSSQANDATFRKCYEFLANKGTLLIFPEGNSFNERRLRSLKSGTARMALGAEHQQNFTAKVKIVPIGLNYSDPTQFQSKLFINIGEPISVSSYQEAYNADPYKAAQDLTDTLKNKLEELIVVTATEEEDELVQQIETIYKTDLTAQLKLNPNQADRLFLTKGIIESVRYFCQHEPERVQAIRAKITAYQQNLRKLQVKDKHLKSGSEPNLLLNNAPYTLIYLLFGLPVYLWGVVTNYIPYYIPAKIADKLSDEEEFRAPIMMTSGIFTFSIWYALIIYLFHNWFQGVGTTLALALSLPFTGFFVLNYYYKLSETRKYLRVFNIFNNKETLIKKLLTQRVEIIQDLEAAKHVYFQYLDSSSVNSSFVSAD